MFQRNNNNDTHASAVQIGSKSVGDGHPCYVVAEIGINHNGDIDLAKRLISVAVGAGCDAIKFQKRTVDVVYTAEELAKPRESPFGTSNGFQSQKVPQFDAEPAIRLHNRSPL